MAQMINGMWVHASGEPCNVGHEAHVVVTPLRSGVGYQATVERNVRGYLTEVFSPPNWLERAMGVSLAEKTGRVVRRLQDRYLKVERQRIERETAVASHRAFMIGTLHGRLPE